MADVNNEVKIKVTLDSQEAEAKLAELYQKAQNLVNNATANQSGEGGGGGVPPSGNGGGGDSPSDEQREQRRQRNNAKHFNDEVNRNARLFGKLAGSALVGMIVSDITGLYYSSQRHAGQNNFNIDKAEAGTQSALKYGGAGMALGAMIAGPVGAAVVGGLSAVLGKYFSDRKFDEKARLLGEAQANANKIEESSTVFGFVSQTEKQAFDLSQSYNLDRGSKIRELIKRHDEALRDVRRYQRMTTAFAEGRQEAWVEKEGSRDQRAALKADREKRDSDLRTIAEREAVQLRNTYSGEDAMGEMFSSAFQRSDVIDEYNRKWRSPMDPDNAERVMGAQRQKDAIDITTEALSLALKEAVLNPNLQAQPHDYGAYGDAYSRMGVNIGGVIDVGRLNSPIIDNLEKIQQFVADMAADLKELKQNGNSMSLGDLDRIKDKYLATFQ